MLGYDSVCKFGYATQLYLTTRSSDVLFCVLFSSHLLIMRLSVDSVILHLQSCLLLVSMFEPTKKTRNTHLHNVAAICCPYSHGNPLVTMAMSNMHIYIYTYTRYLCNMDIIYIYIYSYIYIYIYPRILWMRPFGLPGGLPASRQASVCVCLK